MVWAFPVVCLPFLFLAIHSHQVYHYELIFKVFLHNLGFSVFVSFIYRRTKNFGISVLIPLVLIFLFSLKILQNLTLPLLIPLFFLLLYEVYYLVKEFSLISIYYTIVAFLFLLITFLPYFSMEYSQLDSYSRLIQSYLNNDTLYHISISAMWKNYQFVSHGLHGLGDLAYHFGSHVLMAGASSIIGISVFESYSHFFGFFCIPLLFLSIVSVSEEYFPSYDRRVFTEKLLVLATLILGSGILDSTSLLYRFGLWPGLYQSESYIISLILFMAFLSLLKGFTKSISISKGFGIALVLLLVSFSKVSTGFFGLSCLGFWTLFSPKELSRHEIIKRWVLFGITSLILLIYIRTMNPTKGDGFFSPFHFLNTYVESDLSFLPKLIVFVFIHFLFPSLAILLYFLLMFKTRKQNKVPSWWIYNLFFMTFVGALVILLLYVLGGSGFYVSNVSMFMAIPVLMAIPQIFYKKVSPLLKYSFLVCQFLLLGFYAPKVLVAGVLDFRRELIAPLKIDNELSVYIDELNLIRKDKQTLNSLVYIPRTEIKFWKSGGYDPTCRSASFIISGISERPAIFGWPDENCYSLLCSDRFQSNGLCRKSIQSYDEIELLAEAKLLGFNEVIVLTKNGTKKLQ